MTNNVIPVPVIRVGVERGIAWLSCSLSAYLGAIATRLRTKESLFPSIFEGATPQNPVLTNIYITPHHLLAKF